MMNIDSKNYLTRPMEKYYTRHWGTYMLTAKELCEEIKQSTLKKELDKINEVVELIRYYNGNLIVSNYIINGAYIFKNEYNTYKEYFVLNNYEMLKEILTPLGYKLTYEKSEPVMFYSPLMRVQSNIYGKRNWFGMRKIIGQKNSYNEYGMNEKIRVTIKACCGEE